MKKKCTSLSSYDDDCMFLLKADVTPPRLNFKNAR